MHALGDHRADLLDCQQVLDAGVHQRIEAAEVSREVLGGGLADVADTEPEEKAGQGCAARGVDRLQEVCGGLLGHALELGQLEQAEAVEVGQRTDDAAVDQLLDDLVAEAIDVHGPPLRKVKQRLLALRRADQAAAATVVDLALLAHRQRAAHRAGVRHGERHGTRRTTVRQHADHLGDHIAGAAHNHRIANAHVLALDLAGVMQRGIGHRHAADKHRRQPRHRGQLAGAADLHFDGLDRGQHLLRRILVRHRPARLARDKSELRLHGEAIDLVDHAIDVERQAVAASGDVGVEADEVVHRAKCALVADRQAERAQRVEHAGMRCRRGPALRLTKPVGEERERPLRGDSGVELADAAGGGVARVDKGLVATRPGGLVERLKIIAAQVDLAAHLEHRRRRVSRQAQGDGADGAHVLRHVLAGLAVAAGGSLHQHAVLVAQVDGESVELELGGIDDGRVGFGTLEFAAHAGVEGTRALGRGVRLGADGEHGHTVGNRREALQGPASDAAGR